MNAPQVSTTPHTRDQLVMTNDRVPVADLPKAPNCEATGETYFIRLREKDSGRMRPAVLSFPEAGSYCVVHTPEDYPRGLKTMTADRYAAFVEPKMEVWQPSPFQRKEIESARQGEYDEHARQAGFEDVISYVLDLFETQPRFSPTWADLDAMRENSLDQYHKATEVSHE